MDIQNFSLSAATLAVLIFGMVEFCKQLGIQGRALRLLSLALGLALASIFQLRQLFPSWTPWIDLLFFGLAGGLTAAGIFGFIDKRWAKVPPEI